MFRKSLHTLFKRLTTRTIGLGAIVGFSFLHLNYSYKTISPTSLPPSSPAIQSPPQPQISLPQNQSYYLIVYDPSKPQIIDVIKSLLSKQKQQLIFLTSKEYQTMTSQEITQPITIFYKGSYLPYKIKLDTQKGDVATQARNIENFIVTLDSAQNLEKLIRETQSSFENPLFLVNVYNKEGEKVLKTQIIALAQLHLLNPLQHKIHIVRHDEDAGQQNTYHVMKNDIISQLNNEYELATFDNPPKGANQELLSKSRVKFIEFLLPRVHTIKDVDDYLLYQQRTTLDKEKYTISIKINPHDPLSEEKLKILHDLYQKYQNKFTFVIFATSKFKSFMVHTHKDSDDFVLFNPDKKLKSNILQRPTYQKLFLGNYDKKQTFQNNLQKIDELIIRFLKQQIKADNLNVIPTERHFEVNIEILENILKTRTTPFTVGVCSKKCESKRVNEVDYWIDYSIHNIGITEETYLRVDPEKKVVEKME